VEEIERYFEPARDARIFSNGGPCHALLTERVRSFTGGLSCVPVANCTLGLVLTLRALVGRRPPERAEVIVPSFTFAATVNAILWAGCVPVFADVEPEGWHLDPAAVGVALEQREGRVAAILACSTFGTPPPRSISDAWENLAESAGVPLVVDSAAGFGAPGGDGVQLGAQGAAETFSFHATKPFAIGEGGLVTTRDPELAARLVRLTNFGFTADRDVDEPGLNAKMDEWHAATALAMLDRIEVVVKQRAGHAAAVRNALADYEVTFQHGADRGTWQFIPALLPTPEARDEVVEAGRRREVEIRAYFSPALHELAAYAGLERVGDLEVTRRLSQRIVSLPMANDQTDDEREQIAACVLDAVGLATTSLAT
jgi:dTDP-4-amino-4,6-dideoxygalactose transaminase